VGDLDIVELRIASKPDTDNARNAFEKRIYFTKSAASASEASI